ncbi:Gfo/Idh/MocA family protein [Parahaliea mediterranea]|uniref:Gfo/Idh/MocA family oxidoreductase n=1 Tax=Parahaliea mediterranea TaxID=651086 RepID=A0A939DF52_9GAMM|nr:Gfo/Idh/MocA family oxidoreductase [Parahaliea mediterranea]MBN7796387.1 Gfo/Idh/MocA family oxidoreductase [Parahaliea mediterranea]
MASLKLGMVGSGFMGKAHAMALHTAPVVFPLSAAVRCDLLADHSAASAQAGARRLGFSRSTGDWRELVADPAIDIVSVCAPNDLHYPIARAALLAGKHVFCEKPLALDVGESRELARLARSKGRVTLVGFNYVRNPVIGMAAELIARGELGAIHHVRATHVEDYLADPARSGGWRTRRATAGLGALGDLCHVLSLTQRLAGGIAEVCADMQTVIAQRPGADGSAQAVENEDQAHALVRFSSGAIGTIECSRIAWGRKNGLTIELSGSEGSLYFDQERQNELWLYRRPRGGGGGEGFQRVLLGPDQPDYAAFCPAPGHGLGFNDLKVIEVRDLVEAIAGGVPAWPDFAAAAAIDEVLAAMERSWRQGGWEVVPRGLEVEQGKAQEPEQ